MIQIKYGDKLPRLGSMIANETVCILWRLLTRRLPGIVVMKSQVGHMAADGYLNMSEFNTFLAYKPIS